VAEDIGVIRVPSFLPGATRGTSTRVNDCRCCTLSQYGISGAYAKVSHHIVLKRWRRNARAVCYVGEVDRSRMEMMRGVAVRSAGHFNHRSFFNDSETHIMKASHRSGLFTAAALVLVLAAGPALAAGTENPTPPPTDTKTDKPTDKKATDTKPAETKPATDKKSQNEFLEGYRHAYNLIYKQQDYAGGIKALKALGHDDHADVANLIGFSSRKLGRYDDAKVWYEKALVADSDHTRTWQYYGMWHLEQGNRLKAEEHLEKIRYICGGNGCDDYKALDAALQGKGGSY
jgi:hypothetical protein